jgi:hypothetical protein
LERIHSLLFPYAEGLSFAKNATHLSTSSSGSKEKNHVNHRKRVVTTLRHEEPHRVPGFANLTPGVVGEFR